MLLSKAVPFFLFFTRSLLLAVLFLPVLPAFSALVQYMLGGAVGCQVTAGGPCLFAGVDLTPAYANSAQAVNAMAQASAHAPLLFYILLLTLLAQLTISGFRGRVVRTCAVIMWAGLLPLILSLMAMATGGRVLHCGAMADHANGCEDVNPFLSFAYYGNIFFNWLADIAVPLAVLVTALVALTLGYQMLIGRLVLFATQRD